VSGAAQPAWLLHARAFRERSRIVELFTQENGRIAAVAHIKRGEEGLLQPFRPLLVSWRGRGELPTLNQCEAAAPALSLQGRRNWCGLYLNELLLRLLQREDAHPQLFAHYGHVLTGLMDSDAEAIWLRRFERELLDELGYALNLDTDCVGAPIEAEGVYRWQSGQGFMSSSTASEWNLGGRSIQMLRQGEDGDDPAVQRDQRTLMRLALDELLEGKPLKSRQLFQPRMRNTKES
jgi:DNA repair protein RecO (recombination protein O)